MATTYREKLMSDINEVPDAMMPKFYKVVHTIKEQFLTEKPTKHSPPARKLGLAKGKVWMADDFNAPLPDEIVDEFYK
jgi:hypothetical protein